MPLYNLHVGYTFNRINALNAVNTMSWFCSHSAAYVCHPARRTHLNTVLYKTSQYIILEMYCSGVGTKFTLGALHLRYAVVDQDNTVQGLTNHFIHCQRWIECKHTCTCICTCTSMILHRHYDYMLPEAITCCCFSQHFTFNMWSTSCKKKKTTLSWREGVRERQRDGKRQRMQKKEGKVDGGGRKERLRELQRIKRAKEENKLWTIFMYSHDEMDWVTPQEAIVIVQWNIEP